MGPYEITGQLGAGGMGEVYKARDTKLQPIEPSRAQTRIEVVLKSIGQ